MYVFDGFHQRFYHALRKILCVRLRHHTNERLCAGCTQQNPSAPRKPYLLARRRLCQLLAVQNRRFFFIGADLHIPQHLWVMRDLPGKLACRLAAFSENGEKLQRRQLPVAGRHVL